MGLATIQKLQLHNFQRDKEQEVDSVEATFLSHAQPNIKKVIKHCVMAGIQGDKLISHSVLLGS